MKFAVGQRVLIVDATEQELGAGRSGKVVAVQGRGYKVEIDGTGGGIMYFKEAQLNAR